MTFKHIKFDESSVMRSLEKQANNELRKQASIKLHEFISKFENGRMPKIEDYAETVKSFKPSLLEAANKHANEIKSQFTDELKEKHSGAYKYLCELHSVIENKLRGFTEDDIPSFLEGDEYAVASITDNVLKLAEGLRVKGLHKFANELEANFLAYKKAELYDVTKETGEDLVDQAHPKGSHVLKDVDGKGEFLTVTDKHKRIVDVVNKKPKGKFAFIINQIKLAGADEDDGSLYQDYKDVAIQTRGKFAMQELKKMKPALQKLMSGVNSSSIKHTGILTSLLTQSNNIIVQLSFGTADTSTCDSISNSLDRIKNVFKFLDDVDLSAVFTVISGIVPTPKDDEGESNLFETRKALENKLSGFVNQYKTYIKDARDILTANNPSVEVIVKQKMQEAKATSKDGSDLDTLKQILQDRIVSSMAKLKEIKPIIQANKDNSEDTKSKILTWIDNKINYGAKLSKDVSSGADFDSNVDKYEKEVNAYASKWGK